MQRNLVKTKKYRVGKNTFIVIKIFQRAKAKTDEGNALATNQANVKIFKKKIKEKRY
ncbi:hypothetical protein LOK74_14095 [Brevibacillus humidisoli]|uniref:hypothetical protein n=1 Tax=Brevibacillus humidisoli TaxID=2895522 RepID=UPI001E63D0AC|nr:hypothetical protein [Brevibacillus humidisoli]UFJ39200.1 hypothetical protein LOK74_14095 [Brevibacillus humidisoli]